MKRHKITAQDLIKSIVSHLEMLEKTNVLGLDVTVSALGSLAASVMTSADVTEVGGSHFTLVLTKKTLLH